MNRKRKKKKKAPWAAAVALLLIPILAAGALYVLSRQDSPLGHSLRWQIEDRLYGEKQIELRLRGEEAVVLEYGDSFQDPGAEAFSVGRDGSREALEVVVSGEVDDRTVGGYELEYTAIYRGEPAAACRRSVTVRDTVAPVLTLTDEPGEHDFRAEDNYDGDISALVSRRDEADRIIYTVSDSSGNSAEAVREKTPVFAFADGDTIRVAADFLFDSSVLHAQDMYGRDLSGSVVTEGEITPWRLGSYPLRCSVTDEFGNSAEASVTVEIVPAEMPETVLQEKVIYLTFDDGPAEPTGRLLDLLEKYGAKATFFVTYTDPRYVDMIGRAYREGHSIGLHGYAHDPGHNYRSEEQYFEYFALMQEIIYEQTGEYTHLVRFPGGSSNTNSYIMPELTEDLTVIGCRYYDWNVQPENAERDFRMAAQNMKAVCARICSEGEAPPVVLMHDTGSWVRAAVEMVLIWGQENGYVFKGIDMTTPEVHHRLAAG